MTRTDTTDRHALGQLIRKCRRQRGMTLQALCDKAGVSVGYLSQVERGNATPSLGTLAQIARALDLGLEYFVSRPRPADALSRAEGRPRFSIADKGVSYESLTADFPGHELSSYILHCPPGYISETSEHEGEEFIYVLSGAIEQTLGGETFVLKEGDSLHYDGATPHAWKTLGDAPARILWTGMLAVLKTQGAAALPGTLA